MANRTDIDTFEKLNDVSRTIMADGLIGGKRFADIIIEIMQIAAAYGADEARRSAHFFATTKETDFEQLKAAIVLSATRSEEHTSELQSLMRISYAVFCLKKKNNKSTNQITIHNKKRL